jgi:hypothetical protein
MRTERRIGVALGGVAHAGVPGPAALEGMTPRDRMIRSHGPALIRLLRHRGHDVRRLPRIAVEFVPLVDPGPSGGEVPARRMTAVGDADHRRLRDGMRDERRPDEIAVPRPVVLGVRGRMHPDEPTTSSHEPLKGALLGAVEDVAGGQQEHHHVEPGQAGVGERGGVLGMGARDPSLGGNLQEGVHGLVDAVVPEARRLREDQRGPRRPGRRSNRRERSRQHQRRDRRPRPRHRSRIPGG